MNYIVISGDSKTVIANIQKIDETASMMDYSNNLFIVKTALNVNALSSIKGVTTLLSLQTVIDDVTE